MADENDNEPGVLDESESDLAQSPTRYDITSFGADYDVDGLVKRLKRGDVFIPPFQRDYVWNQSEASRFIESLLLGLPVPGVFLAKDESTNRLLVIDGQQRLKSLQFFYEGYFNPDAQAESKKVFKLQNVQERFEGATYKTLDERDRIHLDNTVIHATVIKQQSPSNDDTSIYHVFERLNTGGRKLTPQEIRLAVYHGPFMALLSDLNAYVPWREIYGKESKRLKDQELVLRFLALLEDGTDYRKPMIDFLNRYSAKHRNAPPAKLLEFTDVFQNAINLVRATLGTGAFRRGASLNAAIFDACMVGIATRLRRGPITKPTELLERYNTILHYPEFVAATEKATANDSTVKARLSIAISAFESVE